MSPKGKVPSLIGSSNGKPEKVDVARKSTCARCKASIEIGEDCYGIPNIGSRFNNIRRFCRICYEDIISQTQKDLDELKNI